MREVTIGDLDKDGVLKYGDGYRTKRAEHGRPGFRILRVADVSDGFIRPDGDDFVAEFFRRQIGAKLSEPGDVLLTTKGTVGRVATVPTLSEQLVYSPQLCFFRVLMPEVLDRRFLHFWLKSPQFVSQASHRMNNTDMAAYINLADIRSLVLVLPEIAEQRAIAEVLGALDDKIAANDRLIATANRLSTALFDQAVIGGGQQQVLAEAAQFHNRRRIPLSARQRQDRRGSVPYYGAAGLLDHVDEALFDDRLALVGEDGSVVKEDGSPVLQYVWGPSWVNNHAHVLTGRQVSTELLNLALQRTNVTALVTGAVQPKINMGNLKALVLVLPVKSRLPELEARVEAIFGLLRAKTDETRLLAQTRDELLPLLMSGKVTVKDAEEAVEEVV